MELFKCAGGRIILPFELPLVDRGDGGNLVVVPPREVWERSELDRFTWAANNRPLTPSECSDVVSLVTQVLLDRYEFTLNQLALVSTCAQCGYPTFGKHEQCSSN